MQQGSFPPAGLCCPCHHRYYDPIRRPSDFGATSRVCGYTHRLLPGPQSRGRGGPPQFPCPPSNHPAPPTPEGSSAPASPGLQRLPWPSPICERLGTLSSLHELQDSLNAAGWSVAHPPTGFDAALRRRVFPRRRRQPATGPPGSYPDRTCTGWRTRTYAWVIPLFTTSSLFAPAPMSLGTTQM